MSEPFDDEMPTTDDDAVARPATGHARIDEALDRLDRLDDLEITQHPEEFDAIHRVLRESLASAGRDGDSPDAP
jgi:hypothetical protein